MTLNFTPHLMSMNRGILSSIYVRLTSMATVDDLRATLGKRYAGEPFVHVLDDGAVPATRHVRGSNHCLIGVFADRVSGRAIILSVIANLVKGASGQAIQNMNLVCGLDETTGLTREGSALSGAFGNFMQRRCCECCPMRTMLLNLRPRSRHFIWKRTA